MAGPPFEVISDGGFLFLAGFGSSNHLSNFLDKKTVRQYNSCEIYKLLNKHRMR